MQAFLQTLDGNVDIVMRYSWNMTVTAFLNGLIDEVAPPIQAIIDEFEDEIMVMKPEIYDDPIFIRMLQATSFISEFIRRHYVEQLSKQVKVDELMYYAYDESTGTLILEHVEGFKNENNFN